MALAASFGIGMLAWWAWRESEKRIYLTAFYLCMGLGMLAKGPVALFLAAAVITVFVLTARQSRLIIRTLWLPGISLFCAITLPWYVAVQLLNPQFFREFILQHNLARFSSDLYHHRQPFWYYLPVTALAFVPWTAFIAAAFFRTARRWWAERKSVPAKSDIQSDLKFQFSLFACCWLIVPLIFFSVSQSKLPGYILPIIPAGAILLADYLRQYFEEEDEDAAHVSKRLVILHALVSSAPIVPALLIAYAVTEHHLPAGRPMFIALAIAFVLCAAIALTIASRLGLRMLRFVTLIPVVLSVAAVLKLGSTAIDQTLSSRPLAIEISSMETNRLPLAVFGVRREMEYGLNFYRNQQAARYESGNIPEQEHLLVAPENRQVEIATQTQGRRVSFLGHYAPQHVDYYWVSAAPKIQSNAQP
jgi:4-amino-4-deoxy-L-arabinose transferase-like glycosyltransferase